VIFPYGLYASQGYWYCACFDRKRKMNVPMRADRFLSAERIDGFEPPQELSVRDWMDTAREAFTERLWVRARVTERGGRGSSLRPSSAGSHPRRAASSRWKSRARRSITTLHAC